EEAVHHRSDDRAIVRAAAVEARALFTGRPAFVVDDFKGRGGVAQPLRVAVVELIAFATQPFRKEPAEAEDQRARRALFPLEARPDREQAEPARPSFVALDFHCVRDLCAEHLRAPADAEDAPSAGDEGSKGPVDPLL